MKKATPICKLKRTSSPGYKYPKLGEMCEFLDIYPYDITRKSIELFNAADVNGHDARYDTTALYLSFFEGAKKFDVLKETALKYLQCDNNMLYNE